MKIKKRWQLCATFLFISQKGVYLQKSNKKHKCAGIRKKVH